MLELGGEPESKGLDGDAAPGASAQLCCRWDRGATEDEVRSAITDGSVFVGTDGALYGECAPPADALARAAATVEAFLATAAAAHAAGELDAFDTTLGQRHWTESFAHVGERGAMRAAFVPPPRVHALSPARAPASGRLAITLTGGGFGVTHALACRFGDADNEAFDADCRRRRHRRRRRRALRRRRR